MINLKKAMYQELVNNKAIYRVNCSREENEKYENMKYEDWPEDIDRISADEPGYCRYSKGNMTDEQIKLYLLAKQTSNLRVIKGCVVFFVILAVAAMIVSLVMAYQAVDALNSYRTIFTQKSLF